MVVWLFDRPVGRRHVGGPDHRLPEPGWIDEEGTPITSAGRLTERFRRLNYGTLEIQITVDDPKTFTKPWTYTLNQRLMPDTELIEFVCLENNTSLKHLVGR